MGFAQMSVFDFLVAELGNDRLRIGRKERVVRQRFGRTRAVCVILPIDIIFRAHPEPGVLMGDDSGAGCAVHVVGARMIRMPMGVDQ